MGYIWVTRLNEKAFFATIEQAHLGLNSFCRSHTAAQVVGISAGLHRIVAAIGSVWVPNIGLAHIFVFLL